MSLSTEEMQMILTGGRLVVLSPGTRQQEINSVLQLCGFSKADPIPPHLSDDPLFRVDFSSLSTLTSRPLLLDLFTSDSKFFAAYDLSLAEFLLFHAELEEDLSLTRETDQSPSHPSSHIRTLLTTGEQLLLWLTWIKSTPTTAIQLIFGPMTPATEFHILDHVTRCINSKLGHLICWPTAEQRRQLCGYLAVCDKAFAILDGTHCEIQKPTHNQRASYSGNKKKWTQNFLVCVDAWGFVIRIDGPFPGAMNDRGCWNQTELALTPSQFVSEGERILADGGFMGGEPLLVPLDVKDMTLARDEKEKEFFEWFNEDLTEGRILVEDVFGWLKGRAKVLGTKWERSVKRQGPMFNAICAMHNFVRWRRVTWCYRH
jgi:hypothetical protein